MTITLTWRELHTQKTNTQTFDLDATLTIGRSLNNTIVLNDKGVSRRHAFIHLENDVPLLIDSSTNGTWMHAQAIKQCELKRNMRFQIMSHSFTVVAIEAPAPSKPAAESKKPNAVKPAMDLAELIKKQPFIENLIDLMPDKETI
ncbi:MAG: FHA domain-containing protein [Chitinophagales bacterium]